MKIFKAIATLLFCMAFLFNVTSCRVVYFKKDNGKHKGWYKNPHNPHNPNHVENKNPGNGVPAEKSKGKSGKH
jgi:hypothetical protein